MKKVLVVCILICQLFFIGCSNNKNIEKENLYNENIEIHGRDFVKIPINCAVFKTSKWSEKDIIEWENYLLNDLSLSTELHFVDSRNLLMDIEEKKLTGIIYLVNTQNLIELLSNNKLQPLNDFLNSTEIKALNQISQQVINSVSDSKNNIYIIPSLNSVNYTVRSYNKEWLEFLNVDVPETINEFTDLAKMIKNDDPDKNGIDDTFIAKINYQQILVDLKDIFISFGVYPDISNNLNNIAFNPKINMFEDIVFNEGFIAALEYIRFMVNSGYITNNTTNIDYEQGNIAEQATNIKVGSIYSFPQNTSFAKCDYSLFLAGNNNKELIEVISYFNGIAVLNETNNYKEILKEFYNSSTTNAYTHLALVYGVPGKHYIELEKEIIVLLEDGDGNAIRPLGINTIGQINLKPVRSDTLTIEEANLLKKTYYSRKDIIEEKASKTASSIFYSLNLDIFTVKYESQISSEITNIFNELVFSILKEDIPIIDAIDNYKMKVNKYKLNEIINNMNNKYHKISK